MVNKECLEMKKYICIAKCPELDDDNLRHCIATKEQIQEREERLGVYCPCGNEEKWVLLKR